MRRLVLAATAALFGSTFASTAVCADAVPSLDLRGFRTSTDPASGLYLEPADSPGTGEWNVGAFTNYAYRPVGLTDQKTGTEFHVINHQLTGDFVGGIGLFHRLAFGVDVPYVIFQTGDKPTADVKHNAGDIALPSQAFGDVALNLKATLIRPTAGELGGFALALDERFTLPTGDEASFIGEGAVTSETRVLAEIRAVALGVHGALGVKLRGDEGEFGCAAVSTANCPTRFGHEIPFGLGLSLRPQALGIDSKGRFTFYAETHGYVPLAPIHPFQSSAVSELQADLGARVAFGDLSLLGGVEKALLHGVGNADVRGVLSISWAPRIKDRDGDGIPDDVDQCPDLPEDFDGFQDADGCPDGDNDDDGIPDAEDACPNQAGPPNPDPKKNGCPDPNAKPKSLPIKDRDGDGIPDDKDKCPDEPEDIDGFQDADGCPDPDNDQDGIPDKEDACPDVAGPPSPDPKLNGCPDPDTDKDTFVGTEDKCPDQPEDFNGFEDEDGCPDATKKEAKGLPPLVVAREKEGVVTIAVAPKIVFAADGVDKLSTSALRAIAVELKKHPTWFVTVGIRPKPNQDPAEVTKRAELVAAKLNGFARRVGGAKVGEWKDVKNTPRAEEHGIGFAVSVSAAAASPPAKPPNTPPAKPPAAPPANTPPAKPPATPPTTPH